MIPGTRSGATETVTISANRKRFRLISNYALTGSIVPVRAVVVTHGVDHNAGDYHARMLAAVEKAKLTDTLVIAPWFEQGDGWKSGGLVGGKTGAVSSFTVLDELLELLPLRFPHLGRVAVAGHSAGAQYVQRYAMFGVGCDLPTHYVVMNPSSFCFLDDWRPVSTSKCPKFNQWKYGLASRTGYAARSTADEARARYAGRTVTICNGSKDNVANNDIDLSCAAVVQGAVRASRLSRGTAFHSRVKTLFPDSAHDRVVVPGVGHSSSQMFASPLVWRALFGI